MYQGIIEYVDHCGTLRALGNIVTVSHARVLADGGAIVEAALVKVTINGEIVEKLCEGVDL